VPVLIKTAAADWPALRDRIAALHPYELPEVIALRVDDGLPAYLAWVASVSPGVT
jgi:periplasmic divalent cation tolerance protein